MITAQIKEGVIQDDFQQIPSATEAASQLMSGVRWLETQAFDTI